MQKIIVREVRFNPHEVWVKNWRTQKTGISKFYEILSFSDVWFSLRRKKILVKSKLREVRFNPRLAMSHRCDYSLTDSCIVHCTHLWQILWITHYTWTEGFNSDWLSGPKFPCLDRLTSVAKWHLNLLPIRSKWSTPQN